MSKFINMRSKSDLIERMFLLFLNLSTLGLVTASTEKSIKIMLWLTYVVVGSLLYVTGSDQIIWLPYLVGLVFYIRLVGLEKTGRGGRGSVDLLVLIAIYFLYILLHSAVHFSSVPQLLVGYKAYLVLWSFAFLLAYSTVDEEGLLRCWRVFLSIASIQLVVAGLQTLIVVPIRGGNNAWDAVVGTFGGNPFYGGNSGGMAIFLLFVIGMVVSLNKYQLIQKKKFYFYLLACMLPILLAEVKVVVILIPLLILSIYFRSLARRPLATLSIFGITVVGAVMVLAVYQSIHYAADHDRNMTEVLEYTFGEISDDDGFYNERTGELGRITAIKFWSAYMETEPLENWLFGYGLAESRTKSSAFSSDLASQFIFNIDKSSMTVLLWDVGVVGFVLILILMLYSIWSAFAVARNEAIPLIHRALLEACAAGLVIIFATLPYSKAMIDTPMTQLLMMWCIGIQMYWKNRSTVKHVMK